MSNLPSFFSSNNPTQEVVLVDLEADLRGEIRDVMGQLTELTHEKLHSLDSDHLEVKKETLLNDKERIHRGELDTDHLDKEDAMRRLQRKINEIRRIILSRNSNVIRDTSGERRRSKRRSRKRRGTKRKNNYKHKKRGSKRRRKSQSSRRRKISCRVPTKYPR